MFVPTVRNFLAGSLPAGSPRSGELSHPVIAFPFSSLAAQAMAGILMLCSIVAAQTQIDLPTQTKRVDFTGASYTRPFKAGTTLPATCTTGDMFFKTDAAPGLNVYGCSQTNTWTVESSAGSSGGSLTIESNGVAVGSRSVADFIAGAGLASLITDTGSQINVQLAMDTALIQTQFGEQTGVALLCSSQTGSSTTYSCALNPTLPAYSLGMLLHWVPDVNGAGGLTTLNVDTLGAKPVKLDDGATNPSSSSIVAGKMLLLWYDGSVFRLLSTASSGSDGSGGSAAYVADPGANGIPYRSAAGSASLADAAKVSSLFACLDTGSANSYACNLSPAASAYSAGTVYWFKVAAANTGASTINLNSLGAVPIKKAYSQDLAANDIRAGQWVVIVYDGANMQMISPTANALGAASAIRSKELFLGGYNNWGSGWAPGGGALQTSGGMSGNLVYINFGNTTSANSWQFRWDANWDNTQPVNLLITAADIGGNAGNFKLDWTVACLPAGSNVYSAPVFGAVSSTGPITFAGTNTKEIALTGLDVSSSACAPNMLTVIKASRDNSISGNSADGFALYSATLTYSVK